MKTLILLFALIAVTSCAVPSNITTRPQRSVTHKTYDYGLFYVTDYYQFNPEYRNLYVIRTEISKK